MADGTQLWIDGTAINDKWWGRYISLNVLYGDVCRSKNNGATLVRCVGRNAVAGLPYVSAWWGGYLTTDDGPTGRMDGDA